MQRVSDVPSGVRGPDEHTVLEEVFDISAPAADICTLVFSGGLVSTRELAIESNKDRSTVTDCLQELVAAGILESAELDRETGGTTSVYYPQDTETLERKIRLGLHEWTRQATTAVAGLLHGEGSGDDEPEESSETRTDGEGPSDRIAIATDESDFRGDYPPSTARDL